MDDFIKIYKDLDFLSESIRLQYANFILRNHHLRNISMQEITKRLRDAEPIEYIFNLAEFYGEKLYVDQRVLIPRHETENLVTHTLKYIHKHQNEKFTILDIGTGSGCISISIAKNIQNNIQAKIIALDKYKEPLEVAKINIENLHLNGKIELLQKDFRDINFNLFDNLIVCANLPYIPNSRKLQKSVINFEPKTALFGGEKGNELIEELKRKLHKINNVRFAILEIDNGQIEIFRQH